MSSASKIYDLILLFDNISPSPGLSYLGLPRFSNIIGTFFTLLAFSLSIVSVWDDVKDFVSRKSPTLIKQSNYNSEVNMTFHPLEDKMFYQIQTFDVENQVYHVFNLTNLPDNFVYPIISYKLNLPAQSIDLLDFDLVSPADNLTTKVSSSNLIKCPSEYLNDFNDYLEFGTPLYSQRELDLILQSSLCMPPIVPLNITNFSDQHPSHIFEISMSDEFAKTILQLSNYSYFYVTIWHRVLETNTDSQNYYTNTYFKKVWKSYKVVIDTSYLQVISASIKKTTVERKRKLLMFPVNDESDVKSIELSPWITIPIDDMKKKGYPMPYLSVEINSDNFKDKITIEYVSLDTIIGNFGGTIGVLFFITQIVTNLLLNPYVSTSIINATMDFHVNDSVETTPEEKNSVELSMLNLSGDRKELIDLEKTANIQQQQQTQKKKLYFSVLAKKSEDQVEESNSEANLKFIESLKKQVASRRHVDIPYCDMFKSFNMKCCYKETFIEDALRESIDPYFEITEFIKLYKEVDLLKKLTLTNLQQSLFTIPSTNLKKYQESKKLESLLKENEKEVSDDLLEMKNLSFLKNLNEKLEILKGVNLSESRNKVLVDNIVSSIT